MIEKTGGTAAYVSCDVTKEDQVDNLIAETVRRFGRIDVMVNNAGIYRNGKRLHEFDVADLDVCFDVNVRGTLLRLQGRDPADARPGRGRRDHQPRLHRRPAGASQPVASTTSPRAPRPTSPAAWRSSTARTSIRVNGICPTYAKTSLTRALFDDKDFDQVFTESIPLKRWGEVYDIANLAVFLASDESSYIHGDLIKVDGGETLCRYSV